jgi:hypothetical protein
MINKFRIFDKLENKYCEEPDYRWLISRNGKLYNSENDEWHTVGERYIVEFATGINDKNNIELFMGDICKVDEWYPSDYIEDGFIGEIMYEDGSFFIYRDIGKRQHYQELDSCSVSNRNIVKIGNKFESAILLLNNV